MGDSEITIARNCQVGANGRLWMDTLPFTGEYTTYALQESNPSRIDYVTDWAASGTGWALSTLLTKGDQSLMTINYATRAHLDSQDHPGSEVRIAAQGPQASDVVGVTNQTDLFHTMARALGLD